MYQKRYQVYTHTYKQTFYHHNSCITQLIKYNEKYTSYFGVLTELLD